MAPSFTEPPPKVPNLLIAFPKPHVLLVTLNRPRQLNAIPFGQHVQMDALWRWYDAEPSLRCAVLTGAGRAFCAGADLREFHDKKARGQGFPQPGQQGPEQRAASGFGGMSNRVGKKPVIVAANGLCLGGGMEMAVNADLVVAADEAQFGLPEVTVGVVAIAGALPRLIRSVGRQRATEMALTGKMYSAEQMLAWGIVTKVVPRERLLDEAVSLAETIAGNSPDAVIVTREGLQLGWEAMSPREGTDKVIKGSYRRLEGGENMTEGLASFVERRKPLWRDSKL